MKRTKSRTIAMYVILAFIWSILIPAGAFAAPVPADNPNLPRISNLADNAAVSGKIEVQAAMSAQGQMVFLIDGKVAAITNIAPYRFDLDANKLTEGAHALQAQFYTANGETISSKVKTILVGNGKPAGKKPAAPKLEVKAPAAPSAPLLSKAAKALTEDRPEQTIASLPETPRASEQEISITQPDNIVVAKAAPAPIKIVTADAGNKSAWKMNLTAAPRKAFTQKIAPQAAVVHSSPSASAAKNELGLLPNPAAPALTPGCQLRPEPESSAVLLPTIKESSVKQSAPAKELAAAPMKSLTAPQTSAPKRDFKYVVVKGDTLSSIAERYGARPSEIVMVNKLQTEKLQIGQQLTISFPSPFLSKGKLMVPIRAVVEACGGRVEWSAKHGEITVNTATTKIVFRVRQAWALVNGKAVALVQKVAMRNNRTFVPLENLKELAALPVRYEPQINRILVARLSN